MTDDREALAGEDSDTDLLRRASESERRDERHWPADLLAQAAETIDRLRRLHQGQSEHIVALRTALDSRHPEPVKPSREDVARILNPVAWRAYDAMMATHPDETTNPLIVEDSLAKADAVIARLPEPVATLGACARCSALVVVPDTDPDNMEQECCPKCTVDIVRERPESVVKAEGLREVLTGLEDLMKPTESGRYAEAGYNDHFNDGVSAAIEHIEKRV